MRKIGLILGLVGLVLLAGCMIKHARKERVEIFTAHWSIASAKEVKGSLLFPGMATPLTTPKKFVAVTLLIENNTREPFSMPMLDFSLEDGDGRNYPPKKADVVNSELGPIPPNKQLQFLVVFEVMRDASGYLFRFVVSSDKHSREKHCFDLGF